MLTLLISVNNDSNLRKLYIPLKATEIQNLSLTISYLHHEWKARHRLR